MKNDITFILDRSGSMSIIKDATIKNFNSFLLEQKDANPDSNVSLILFDDEYITAFEGVKIKDVQLLSDKSYIPRGCTALLDAIGTTIQLNHQRLKNSIYKPENVLLIIITDGAENASTKYKRNEIFKMIRKKESKYNWTFIFLGANQDAISEGASLGIASKRSLTFSPDDKGIEDAISDISYSLMANKISDFEFDESSRLKQNRIKK